MPLPTPKPTTPPPPPSVQLPPTVEVPPSNAVPPPCATPKPLQCEPVAPPATATESEERAVTAFSNWFASHSARIATRSEFDVIVGTRSVRLTDNDFASAFAQVPSVQEKFADLSSRAAFARTFMVLDPIIAGAGLALITLALAGAAALALVAVGIVLASIAVIFGIATIVVDVGVTRDLFDGINEFNRELLQQRPR